MVLGMDVQTTEPEALRDLGNLARFFEEVDLTGLEPSDERALDGTEYLLSSPDGRFVAYSSMPGGRIGLKGLSKGSFRLTWFDCVTGATNREAAETKSGDQSWKVPPEIGTERVLYGIPMRSVAIPVNFGQR